MGPEELGGTWRRMSAASFGAIDAPGGWTGTELVLVDPDDKRRATSYLPALDSWSNVAKPPRKLPTGTETLWTGTELVFVEPRGTSRRGLTLYDPVVDQWRTTSASPLNEIATAIWAGDRLVAGAATGARVATYDPLTDLWEELPAIEDALVTSLHWTGEDVIAFVRLGDTGEFAFVPLELEAGEWGDPSIGPLTEASSDPLWIGDTFVSLAEPEAPDTPEALEVLDTPAAPDTLEASEAPVTKPAVDARYDPRTNEWAALQNECGIDTTGALWAEPLILDVDRRIGLDPETGSCYVLPLSPWVERTGALRVWTGNEVLEVSGDTGGKKPRRDGVAYDPYPGDDSLGVVLDKRSRAVRVQVPALGIDLPVVWDKRKVPGRSKGYPACDVAESWSVFDQPGAPGTAWINAHAQPGMFLPLLQAMNVRGKTALLGREVELQLRDGRVLTYRTYRVNPRATNANLGIKGRKKNEHRLVLQTSTGIGSAPKLLVAARLVDVGTTDEPRPKPRPRACG